MPSFATGVSRRVFLRGGLAAFGLGAFGGLRLFAAPAGWKHPGKANLVVGVVSDTHLITDKEGRLAWLRGPEFKVIGTGSPAKYFAAALKYFRDQNVDAVLHCGDITDSGQIREMEAAAALWRRVFPNDRAPDGHRVAKLFVTGNHDAEGMGMRWLKAVWPDLEERKRLSFTSDIPGIWERIWGEKYEPVWHKEVKGYHFLGRHWETDWTAYQKMVRDFMGEQGASSRPFFMLSHSQDGKTDAAKAAKAEFKKSMSDCRNAVAFCGHWHQSLTNWNMILFWLNENVPELRCPSCAPFGGLAPHHDGWIFKNKKAGVNAREIGAWRQGMVMRVYDDMIVFQRKEFDDDGVSSLGQDWIMPLGKYAPHPFSREELRKIIGSPQFGKNAGLKVESVKLESGEDAVRVSIPLADGNPKSRVYAYEVVVSGEECSQNLVKSVYDAGCNVGIGHEPGVTTLVMPKSELPPGNTLTVAVRPFSSLGTLGMAIAAKFET